jgi:copper chaperone CopZ
MSCTGCEENVVDALSDVPGVESVSADHEANTATVDGDADLSALEAAIEDSAYEVAE